MADDLTLPPKLLRVELRIAASDLRAMREASVRARQNLSEWIRHTCAERMAREKETKEPKKR